MGNLNVLLFGVGYFPRIISGDKNFFFRLVPVIATKLDKLAIVSINDQRNRASQNVNGKSVPIYNLKRALHYGNPDRYYAVSGELLDYRHKHEPLREAVEKQVAVLASLRTLATAIKENDVRVIHFMDNCGLAMPLVKHIFAQVRVSCSAPNYNRRPWVYRSYLRYGLGMLDRIVPYTEAYRERLEGMGLSPDKLEVIRWGVPSQDSRLSQQQRRELRASLGLSASSILLVWSGYIQQIQEAAFFRALEVAKQIVREHEQTEFIFAFKPLSYEQTYADHGEDRIKIVSGVQNVSNLWEIADFFFSPVSAVNSTVAPPLTWLEAMSVGTPVITTDVAGVDELVIHKKTGYVAQSFDRLADVIVKAINDDHGPQVCQNAREIVKHRYNIEESGAKYVNMWRAMVHGD